MVSVAGRRVSRLDVHAHAAVPEAMALMNPPVGPPNLLPKLLMGAPQERLALMDAQGIDVQALSINPYWYKADRDVATRVCEMQNEKLAQVCAANPERFVAFATVALQHPDLAAAQLEEGVKKYNLRGAAIGGSVDGLEISDPRFHPFWARAEQLGVPVFIHPQGTAELNATTSLQGQRAPRQRDRQPARDHHRALAPHLRGHLDRFPGLKICAAHGGASALLRGALRPGAA
jgi:aminocarboxymuconate-semialdehyde decarboxylase